MTIDYKFDSSTVKHVSETIEKERIEYLSKKRGYTDALMNLSEGVTFTDKEVKVLINYNLERKLSIGLIIDTINLKDYNTLSTNWKLNKEEVEEFKVKLERLMS